MLKGAMRRKGREIERKVRQGKITKGQAERMRRTVEVGVLHRYYKKTAGQYGYTYGRQKLNSTRR